jgi:DNA-binding GntR family transcriptional regulator
MENLSPTAYRTKTQIAYDFLREAIITARLKPGAPVVISAVAQQLGMSEIPVREALKKLEAHDLILTTPHASAQVADFRVDDLEEVYEVRTVLEAHATRLAAGRITPERMLELEALAEACEEEVRKGRLEGISSLNRRFHERLYEAGGNRVLCRMINELWDRSDRMRGVFTLVPERARLSIEEHRQILEAIRKGEVRRAERLVARQKRNSFRSLRAYMGARKRKAPPG